MAFIVAKCFGGKTQEAYTAFPISKCVDYKCVKNAILRAYELVPEAYCKQNSEFIVNKKVKLLLNLPMIKRCNLTDGVTLLK